MGTLEAFTQRGYPRAAEGERPQRQGAPHQDGEGVDTPAGWEQLLCRMLESLKPRGGKRWPRGQKFILSVNGTAAEIGYREAVHSARAQGRGALDAAQLAWAEPHKIAPADGVVLGELRGGRKSIAEIAKGLEDCGTSAADVKTAVDRLSDAGLVEPAPATTQAAA